MKNKHAFPFKRSANTGYDQTSSDGMTLRQYYAAKAMQSIIARSPNMFVADVHEDVVSLIAHNAFKVADAMIEVGEE